MGLNLKLSLGTKPQTGAAGGGGGGGDDLAAITKTMALADMQALGASQDASVDFDSALPAGAIPLAAFARNMTDTAWTSSGGTPGIMGVTIRPSGQASLPLVSMNSINVSTASSQQRIGGSLNKTSSYQAASVWPVETGVTYEINFTITGAGVTFANLTGPSADLVEVTLVYHDPTA